MLTARQLAILRAMVAAEDAEDFENSEIVREGRSCWLGFERVAPGTVNALLACVAIRMASEPGSLERYVATGTGRLIAADPSVARKVMAAMLSGVPCDAGGNPL